MRIVFMGTPEFAVPCLERLVSDGHEVVLAVTQADKPKGRGYVLTPPPVKETALSHGISVYQPGKIKNNPEALEKLKECRADVAVVVAYGRILPPEALAIPRYGCINVHASLLPKYRGAAPIQWAVLNGEAESGVTTMQMDAGLDTGPMLLSRRCPIPPDMTAGELHDCLSMEGAQALSDTLKALEAGSLRPVEQTGETCYAPMLTREMSLLDWEKPAEALHNQVRGLNPWPSASTRLGGKTLKVHRSRIGEETEAVPGTVIKLNPFTVSCGGKTSLELLEVQYEGGRRMAGSDFLRGHAVEIGRVLPD